MDSVKAPVWIWATLGTVAALSVGASWKISDDTQHTNSVLLQVQRCQSDYMAENSRVSKIRSVAAQKASDAESAYLRGVNDLILVKHPADPDKAARQAKRNTKKFLKLSAEYKKASAEVAAERAKNPLPEFPGSCPQPDQAP